MKMTAEQAATVMAEADILFTEGAVDAAIDRLAAEINAKLSGADPIVLSVMTGGIVLTGRLLPHLHFPLRLDYCHATRYRGQTRGCDLHWYVEPHFPLAGETVLIVDDILDEGHTLACIVDYCRTEGAKAVHCAVLVDKKHDRRAPEAKADFIGLEVPDRYVFGCGMDYQEYLRNAPGIHAVKAP